MSKVPKAEKKLSYPMHVCEVYSISTVTEGLKGYSYNDYRRRKSSKIRQLLQYEEMDDRRFSQFLQHLQILADVAIPELLLHTLQMGRLSSQLQSILATRTVDNLEEVVEQDDKIYKDTCKAVTVASVARNCSKSYVGKTN